MTLSVEQNGGIEIVYNPFPLQDTPTGQIVYGYPGLHGESDSDPHPPRLCWLNEIAFADLCPTKLCGLNKIALVCGSDGRICNIFGYLPHTDWDYSWTYDQSHKITKGHFEICQMPQDEAATFEKTTTIEAMLDLRSRCLNIRLGESGTSSLFVRPHAALVLGAEQCADRLYLREIICEHIEVLPDTASYLPQPW